MSDQLANQGDTDTETIAYATQTEQIALLAYALWEARGCPDGTPERDWLLAEQKLRSSRSEQRTSLWFEKSYGGHGGENPECEMPIEKR
jgi:Protein of unknown function (DUF2934)